jgi:hypothetical protein
VHQGQKTRGLQRRPDPVCASLDLLQLRQRLLPLRAQSVASIRTVAFHDNQAEIFECEQVRLEPGRGHVRAVPEIKLEIGEQAQRVGLAAGERASDRATEFGAGNAAEEGGGGRLRKAPWL